MFLHILYGPVILSAITEISYERLRLSIDLKPAITDEQLDEREYHDFSKE